MNVSSATTATNSNLFNYNHPIHLTAPSRASTLHNPFFAFLKVSIYRNKVRFHLRATIGLEGWSYSRRYRHDYDTAQYFLRLEK